MDLKTYSENISNFIAGSYITSAITLGKDLGLFDELKRLDKPVSSQQLADACNLKERYVREWLGCMVSTSIVLLDEFENYFIPQALKPGLREIDSSSFFLVQASLTSKVKKCFVKDGPQGYVAGDTTPEVVEAMNKRMSDADDVVERLLKPALKLKQSINTILDVGCGAGCVSIALSRRFQDADIYGVDLCKLTAAKATASAKSQGIKNVKFLNEDVTSLPAQWTQKFDWVILYDVLHDLPDPAVAMKEVDRVLKKDGVVSITDPDVHSNHRDNVGDPNTAGVGYAISTVICLPNSLSVDGAPGNGVGWGIENKEAFLTRSNWIVKDKCRTGSHLALNFTCIKKENKTI